MEKHHLFLFLISLLCVFHQTSSAAFLKYNKHHPQDTKILSRHRRQWGELVGYDTDDYDYETQSWPEWGSYIETDYFPTKPDSSADFLEPITGGVFNNNPVPTHDVKVPFPNTREEPDPGFQSIQEILPPHKDSSSTTSPTNNEQLDLEFLSFLFNGFLTPHQGVNMRLQRRASKN